MTKLFSNLVSYCSKTTTNTSFTTPLFSKTQLFLPTEEAGLVIHLDFYLYLQNLLDEFHWDPNSLRNYLHRPHLIQQWERIRHVSIFYITRRHIRLRPRSRTWVSMMGVRSVEKMYILLSFPKILFIRSRQFILPRPSCLNRFL